MLARLPDRPTRPVLRVRLPSEERLDAHFGNGAEEVFQDPRKARACELDRRLRVHLDSCWSLLDTTLPARRFPASCETLRQESETRSGGHNCRRSWALVVHGGVLIELRHAGPWSVSTSGLAKEEGRREEEERSQRRACTGEEGCEV